MYSDIVNDYIIISIYNNECGKNLKAISWNSPTYVFQNNEVIVLTN